jgi:DNA-binding IclR family transcriptional regulator
MSDRGSVDRPAPQGRAAAKEVKSAARTLDVLEFLAARRHRPVRVREISDALGAPRSSVYAVVRTLLDRGWVRTDATGSLYSVGIEALMVGTTYLETDPFLRIVQPQVTALSLKLDETVHYARVRGTDIVYLASEESRRQARPFSRIGRRLPAYCNALGKSLLAQIFALEGAEAVSERLPEVLTPLTPRTILDRSQLIEDLRITVDRGYAVDREENYVGVSCLAVAIDLEERPNHSISCSIESTRLTRERELAIVTELRRTRQLIEDLVPHTQTYAAGHY